MRKPGAWRRAGASTLPTYERVRPNPRSKLMTWELPLPREFPLNLDFTAAAHRSQARRCSRAGAQALRWLAACDILTGVRSRCSLRA